MGREVEIGGFGFGPEDEGEGGDVADFELSAEVLSGWVPVEEDEHASAEAGDVAEDEVAEGLGVAVGVEFDAGEDFEHLGAMGEAAAGGEDVGAVADEHEVEEGIEAVDGAGEGGGEGDGVFEGFGFGAGAEGIEHHGVTDEVFLLELLDHGALGTGPAGPVDFAWGIAGAVVADGGEFLGVADGAGEGDAAALELVGEAGEGDGGEAEAARVDDDGGGGAFDGFGHATEQAEGVDAGDFGVGEGETAAAAGDEVVGEVDEALGWDVGDELGFGVDAGISVAEPAPAVEAVAAIEPISEGFAGFGEGGEFLEGGTGVGGAFAELVAALPASGLAVEAGADAEGEIDGGVGGHVTFDGEAGASGGGPGEGEEEDAGDEGEDLVGHRLGDVGEGAGGDKGPEDEGSGGGDAGPDPAADGEELAVAAVEAAVEVSGFGAGGVGWGGSRRGLARRGGGWGGGPGHGGQRGGGFWRINSSISPSALVPAKRAWGSRTRRWATMGTASSRMCSG